MKPDWIISGFYTPDYLHHAEALRANLDEIGAPHDILPTPKLDGGWETNTRLKPSMMRTAMKAHPGTTVLFLDVDCVVSSSITRLEQLVDISGDVGFFTRTRIRSNGRTLFAPRSGTVVLRPTPKTEHFLCEWIKANRAAYRYANDQDTLVVALGRVPNLSWTVLSNEACAVATDRCPDPIVMHDTSETNKATTSRLLKVLSALYASKVRRQRLAPC